MRSVDNGPGASSCQTTNSVASVKSCHCEVVVPTRSRQTLAADGATLQVQCCGNSKNALTKLARSPASKRPVAVAYTTVVLTA